MKRQMNTNQHKNRRLSAFICGLVLCLLCGSVRAELNANTIWEVRTGGAQTNGGGFRWLSLVSATYKWTASGSGTNEYYCQTAAGGNPSLTEAKCATTDGTFNLDSNGTLGSLTAGQWDWGDNDTLGYSTVYVRLDAGADPDTKNTGFVQIGNGGGYDYTQQAAAQLSLTDLAATSASGWLTLTSVTGGFTALMVGNIIHITSGTNDIAGWYEITAYTNGNTVTVDRACGSVGNMSVGVGAVGGAFLIGGTLDDDFTEAMVAGNTVHVAAGTYTPGENIVQALNGTVVLPIKWIGYTAARNDTAVGTDRPLFACSTRIMSFGYYSIVKNLRFTSAQTSGVSFVLSVVVNCKSQNTSASAYTAFNLGNNSKAFLCEGISTNGTAFIVNDNICLIGCYAHDSVTGYGMSTSTAVRINSCIADTCTTGVSVAGSNEIYLLNCTIYNCTTGILGTTASLLVFINNIIDSCTTGASWTTATPINLWDFNCWNNTTDVNLVSKGPNDITADPLLTNPAAGDFTLQAGSPCLDAGMQIGANEGVTGGYMMNIGVDQDDNAAAVGGGGAAVYMGNF